MTETPARVLRSRRERVKAKAPAILKALIERSGLLRGAGEDEIEFAHNTLKAFLAATFSGDEDSEAVQELSTAVQECVTANMGG